MRSGGGEGAAEEQRRWLRGTRPRGECFPSAGPRAVEAPSPVRNFTFGRTPAPCSSSRGVPAPDRSMDRDYPTGSILKSAVPSSARGCSDSSHCVWCLHGECIHHAHRWPDRHPVTPRSSFIVQPGQLPPGPSPTRTGPARRLPDAQPSDPRAWHTARSHPHRQVHGPLRPRTPPGSNPRPH